MEKLTLRFCECVLRQTVHVREDDLAVIAPAGIVLYPWRCAHCGSLKKNWTSFARQPKEVLIPNNRG